MHYIPYSHDDDGMSQIWENNDVDMNDNLEDRITSAMANLPSVQDVSDFMIKAIPKFITTPSQRRQRIPGFNEPSHKNIPDLDVLDKED